MKLCCQLDISKLPATVRLLAVLATAFIPASAIAEPYYLEVSPADQGDLANLFDALEDTITADPDSLDPVVVVLHGIEAASFTRDNYTANKHLVDRAALLDSQRRIDVRMCETWMNENGIQRSDLPAFIDTVPYAPEELERLKSQGYMPLPSVQI
jgi:intracellular sulfur oxidation DsrE/DsrF family protein